ncbi:hypothetical protein HDF24_19095 [Mucilaginibacter sp. X4EP1]|uniref:hypothetical protein n=1 Tax=Mucilaginibacter sp. X4EP1 TaxID=2723092 RepID=UPI00216A7005|nr:hypothetical protein [Mucilaginibacter sp. X4EP1]MCS3813318.1 hypothetical protein [Mucilaginibacter sp. X4EP1]
MKKTICILLFIFAISQIAIAQQVRYAKAAPVGSWQIIGTTQAKFTADHDGIIVQGPFNNFRSVKLKVTDAPLRLVKMVVTYDNGAPDNIETLYDIPQGGESRIIDLRGVGERKIRRIDFWYDTRGAARGRANVTVFAMK